MKYLSGYKEPRRIHWILKCNSFEDLLDRIDSKTTTKYLKKRYPTSFTYAKKKVELGYDVVVTEYNEEDFKLYYENLKPEKFIACDQKIIALKRVEGEKLLCRLEYSNNVVAIAVVEILDNQLNYMVPVALRSKHSYGMILLMEIIKYGIECRNVHLFTAGKTWYYPYKTKVFLDSRELYVDLLIAMCKTLFKKLIYK